MFLIFIFNICFLTFIMQFGSKFEVPNFLSNAVLLVSPKSDSSNFCNWITVMSWTGTSVSFPKKIWVKDSYSVLKSSSLLLGFNQNLILRICLLLLVLQVVHLALIFQVGTTISTFVVGGIMFGFMQVSHPLTFSLSLQKMFRLLAT